MTPIDKLAEMVEFSPLTRANALHDCAGEIMAVLRSAYQLREDWTGKSDLFEALSKLEMKILEVT